MRPFLVLALGLSPVYLVAGQQPPLSNATLLIIRHAEKPEDGDGLTPVGEKRAQAYVKYFATYAINGKPSKFTHIFAATDSKKSHRPRLTIEPFAKSIGMTIDTRFTDKDNEAFVKELRAHDHGKQILVSWRHGKIPELLTLLGSPTKKFIPEGDWPDDVFDRVIELHFSANGKVDLSKSKLIKEHLMPGDE